MPRVRGIAFRVDVPGFREVDGHEAAVAQRAVGDQSWRREEVNVEQLLDQVFAHWHLVDAFAEKKSFYLEPVL